MRLLSYEARYIVYAAFLCLLPTAAEAQIEDSILSVDSLKTDTLSTPLPLSTQKTSWLHGWWQQLINGHIDRTFEKPVDMSWVVVPTYADDGGFGVGGTASGLFRLNRTDSILTPSSVSLSANATIDQFYSLYLKSNIYFDRKNFLEIYADIQSRNRYFWGIDYHQCDANYDKEQRFRYFSSNIYAEYLYQLPKHFQIGSILQYNMRNVMKIDYLRDALKRDYLQGQDDHYGYLALGAVAQYDTRDHIITPTRGISIMLQQMLHRRLVGNGPDYAWNTIFNFRAFAPLWKGGVLAYDFYANGFDRNVPWPIRQEISADYARMRGYYIGRFFDNNQMNTTLELRQKIWKRFGLTIWYGCGNFFNDWDDYEWKRWTKLPSYGLGLRFEFKKNTNLRLDFGNSKDGPTYSSAFVFDIGEAF